MRILLVGLMLLALGLPAVSQEPTWMSFSILKPAGATVTTEMNISRDQILAQIQTIIGSIPLRIDFEEGKPTKEAEGKPLAIDFEKVKDALATLDRVQYAEMTIKGKYTVADVIGFFERAVKGRRIVYDAGSMPGYGVILLAMADNNGYFGAVIETENYKEGKTNTGHIYAARTFGFPDVGKAVLLATPLLFIGFSSSQQIPMPNQQVR